MIVGGESLVSHAGGVLLVETARRSGLPRSCWLLGRWRKPLATHDPGKIVADLAVAVALGGDAACDVAVLRAQPGVFGPVASDPTVSRLIARLAGDVDAALAAISARAGGGAGAGVARAGAPLQDGQVVIDMDATLVNAHSEKEQASRTWKKGFGFHPLLGFVDHGDGRWRGAGQPKPLRPGPAGSNTAADHVVVFEAALAQVPEPLRRRDEAGRMPVLVRTDAAGATKEFARHLAGAGGLVLPRGHLGPLRHPPARSPCCPRDGVDPGLSGAQAARRRDTGCRSNPATAPGSPRPPGWSTCRRGRPGTRLILRKERPHPGAQLRITDADGVRVTGFLTNTTTGGPARQLADLELRHRRHARVEDRIRAAKDSGMRNLPFHDLAQNRIWRAVAALAAGPARLHRPARPAPHRGASTSPNGCGCGSWPWPDGSCTPRAAAASGSTQPGHGPT